MFKLQRLEITGFKSFADYTEIVFTGSGITAVVGPNGCGKSNVSDSISWVLGEQRAKSLRGGEMKDVVFQGSRNRKPGGMAEVTLHLIRDEDFLDVDEGELDDIDQALTEIDDHSIDLSEIEPENTASDPFAAPVDTVVETNGFHAGELETEKVQAAQVGSVQTVETRIKTKRHWRPRSFALDFAPGEAVSVTRRLYLSGESEYLLNGKSCRLRDIQDLFAGTGLSGAHYAIVEQGRIGQILSAKPGDRRNLIEEAAGISKFRTRQRAAESRLETAKTNLGRVSDIVSEIDKQANSLRRQASKTRRYKVLQEEFRVLLRSLFAAEGRYLTTTVNELDQLLLTAADTDRELGLAVSAKEEAVREATQNSRVLEESLSELRRLHSEKALERDRAEREHRYQTEQVANLNLRLDALHDEIKTTEDRLRSTAADFTTLQKDEQAERELAGKAEFALKQAEIAQQEKHSDLTGIESELESARADLLQHTAGVERFAEIDRQLAHNLEKLTDRSDGLRREAIRAEESYKDHISQAKNLEGEVVSERLKLEGFQSEKQKLLSETSDARDLLRQAEENLKSVSDEFSRNKHRLDTLQELEEKRAVYAPQVQKLFAAQDKIGVKFSGVLADRLNVDQRAEKAVENLFGGYLQALLVDSVKDAQKVAEWLRSNDLGRASILVAPNTNSEGVTPVGAGNGIEDLIGVSPDFAATLRNVFPREMSARLVDDFVSATPGAGEVLVNADGDIMIGGSLIVSGKPATNDKNESLLAFKRELGQLGKAVKSLASDLDNAKAESDKAGQRLAQAEEKMVDLQSLIIKVERGLHGLEIQETSARQEIERAERHKKVVADETAQVEREISEIESRKADAAGNAKTAEIARAAAASLLEEISVRVAAARSAVDTENLILNEKRMQAATSDERRRSAQSALRRIENEEKDLKARLNLLNVEVKDTETKIKNLKESIAEIAEKIASAADDTSNERSELSAAVTKLEEARAASDALSRELADANKRAAEARDERAGFEIRKAESVTLLRNIHEKCSQELNTQLAELVETEPVDEAFDLGSARTQAADLREKLENFGAINMLALEELAEAEERLEFLTSQRQDIIDSIAAAEEALREIKERSRLKFKEAFEAINENFIGFFQELFGGGRGEMTLLESDDILEAGIEVVAQPPGKRLQNILLLSGGEKAMTAIALVLAIFKYRPSPFCLLDEVDAPLDDANVGRFVNKIAEMSERTQFIVITHNKRTMEAARALYGVTMQEAGVSKVVSVRFD
ncbi:MAG TPA: chromosome segregation protein SMC [Pyrinomonadaceae bacterium]|nr:chromosome segregation protein SMC [Pyrinomonadaceae bacterium]